VLITHTLDRGYKKFENWGTAKDKIWKFIDIYMLFDYLKLCV